MRLLWIGAFAFLCSCGDDDGMERDAGSADASADVTVSEGRVEIGTGLTDFAEVAEGGTLELVNGAQGGWHVDIATQLYGLEPMDLNLRMQGFDVETGESRTIVVERILTRRRVRDEGDHFLRLGDQLVFMVVDGSEVVGRSIRVEVEATPMGGTTVRAEKTIQIVDDVP
ncbi:MAG: hypothetical protein AAGE52_21915 [Myxococcota bacterium]